MLIIKIHPEIITKSDSVRKRFIKILSSNIRNSLELKGYSFSLIKNWDNIQINVKDQSINYSLIEDLKNIPGIQYIYEADEYDFINLHDTYEKTYYAYKFQLENKSFCVRVKRTGTHNFTSIEAERYIGGGLNQNIKSCKVKLSNPDIIVSIYINKNKFKLLKFRHKGLGGFPIGTQSEVLSLISGGFDSAVSSFQMIRRGCKVHFLFFNLGGNEHENGVKSIAYYLWKKYSISHKVNFISVNFEEIVEKIMIHVSDGLMGVVLKRMFYRVACSIANKYKINAYITGEALGQVSSQTMANLKVIEEVSNIPIFRPLISFDKEQIIDIARSIGTASISETIPEFCGVISKNPSVAANLQQVELEENKIDIDILVNNSINNSKTYKIKDLKIINDTKIDVNIISDLLYDDIVIDIRDDYMYDTNKVYWNVKSIHIPFFKLKTEFKKLDISKRYVLFCDQGVLSRLQAIYLIENNYNNVAVLDKKFNLKPCDC